jgi:hypothetical protein
MLDMQGLAGTTTAGTGGTDTVAVGMEGMAGTAGMAATVGTGTVVEARRGVGRHMRYMRPISRA